MKVDSEIDWRGLSDGLKSKMVLLASDIDDDMHKRLAICQPRSDFQHKVCRRMGQSLT